MRRSALPDDALLKRYDGQPQTYTDCFVRDVPGAIDLSALLCAFYTTPLFRVERLILRVAAKRPSTDADVIALAQGQADGFAAWSVTDRTQTQILLTDMFGNTCSWFMVTSTPTGTRLHFGSGVFRMESWLYRVLMPFHKLYARALLWPVRL